MEIKGLIAGGRRLVTALERVKDVPELSVRVLKTIGLLNIIGGRGGFRASRELLGLLGDDVEIAHALDELESCSAITFRRFAGNIECGRK